MGYLRCAEGIIDAVIERDINIWDLAAIEPIIKNAGGFITTWEGKILEQMIQFVPLIMKLFIKFY